MHDEDTKDKHGWMLDGACRAWTEANPEEPDPFFSIGVKEVAKAKEICASCDMRPPCRTYIFRLEERKGSSRYGTYAGLTPKERQEIVNSLRSEPCTDSEH